MNVGDTYNPRGLFYGAMTPNWLLRRYELTGCAKLVFGRLCQYCNEEGRAFPSVDDLAAEVGFHPSAVKAAVKALTALGLIRVEQHRGDHRSNDYYFLWHEWIEAGTATPLRPAGASSMPPIGCQVAKQDVEERSRKTGRGHVAKQDVATSQNRTPPRPILRPLLNKIREVKSEEITSGEITSAVGLPHDGSRTGQRTDEIEKDLDQQNFRTDELKPNAEEPFEGDRPGPASVDSGAVEGARSAPRDADGGGSVSDRETHSEGKWGGRAEGGFDEDAFLAQTRDALKARATEQVHNPKPESAPQRRRSYDEAPSRSRAGKDWSRPKGDRADSVSAKPIAVTAEVKELADLWAKLMTVHRDLSEATARLGAQDLARLQSAIAAYGADRVKIAIHYLIENWDDIAVQKKIVGGDPGPVFLTGGWASGMFADAVAWKRDGAVYAAFEEKREAEGVRFAPALEETEKYELARKRLKRMGLTHVWKWQL